MSIATASSRPASLISIIEIPILERIADEKVQEILAACTAQDAGEEIMTLFERPEYQSDVWKVACGHLGIKTEDFCSDDQNAEAEYYFEKVLGHVLEPDAPPAPATTQTEQTEQTADDSIGLTRIWFALATRIGTLNDETNADTLFIWLEENREALLQVDSLDLSGLVLTSLPQKLFEYLPNLERLNLDANQLKSLPDEFFSLQKLNALSLRSNPLPEGVVLQIGKRLPQLEAFSA